MSLLSAFGYPTQRDGQRPRAPVAVRVTLGRQPPDRLGQGYPIAKDRFWIASAVADGQQVQGRNGPYNQNFLPLHPDFAAFNRDPFLPIEQWDDRKFGALVADVARDPSIVDQIEDDNARAVAASLARSFAAIPAAYRATWRDAMDLHRRSRRILRGNLVHTRFLSIPPTADDAAWMRYSANGAKPARGESLIPHPKKLPSCLSSDGQTAHRWDGRDYAERRCDGERCPFRADGSATMGTGPACQRVLGVVFQLRWPDLCWRCSKTSTTCPECGGTGTAPAMPSALAEIECSGSFNIAALAFEAMIADIGRQWSALSLPGEPDLYGLPFVLQLAHKVGNGKDYWTVHVAADFPAGHTLQSWAIQRAQALAQGRALMGSTVPLIESAETARQSYARTRVQPAIVPGDVIDG